MLDFKQAYKYMGMTQSTPEMDKMMTSLERELLDIATPRRCAEVYPAVLDDGYYRLDGTEIWLKSKDINKLFRDVEYISVSVVTLGVAVDKRTEYYARVSGSRMLAFDALASVYVEMVADSLSEEINKQMQGYYPTVRYACGYGDLPLSMQPTVLAQLNADKRVGVSVGESLLMHPLKSMTGFQGYGKEVQPKFFDCGSCKLAKCGTADCPKRKMLDNNM